MAAIRSPEIATNHTQTTYKQQATITFKQRQATITNIWLFVVLQQHTNNKQQQQQQQQ